MDNTPTGGPETRTILVIGLGMTALAFIDKLFELQDESGKCDKWSVIVVGEEPHLAYNRVGLSQYFSHRSIEDLYLQPPTWYSSQPTNRLSHIIDDAVLQMDTTQRKACTRKGVDIKYDVCVIATGSRASLPSCISNTDMDDIRGIFCYRNLEDFDRMIQYSNVQSVKRAAIIGGGLLGLEAAKALCDFGIPQVTVVERNQWVLSRQLDQIGGEMVLDQLKAMNIKVFLNSRLRSILTYEEDGVATCKGMILEDNSNHAFDMVIFTIGITPCDELAKASGVDTHDQGGIVIQPNLKTSVDNVYAIGECASLQGRAYGFIAPGVEMAGVLAFNLTRGPLDKSRNMTIPDTSTRLKLAGVNVACFGDHLADNKPRGKQEPDSRQPRALSYHDPFSGVYKKYIFTADGKRLLGGMMVGDIKDYTKLLSLSKQRKPLDIPAGQLVVGLPRQEDEFDGDDLDLETQVCSCYNIPKQVLVNAVKDGCQSFGEVKARTKAGTGCGGCVPLATSIFNSEMKRLGHTVLNYLCPHFKKSRQDLFMIVKIKKLTTFEDVMNEAGINPGSIGCEICKPAVASILSSLYNEFIMTQTHHQNQDTNDKYLANIQRNGTYSVIPRVPAGEITPAKLKELATVAEKYSLYTKITGGQRIDLFGAKKQDLPNIWEQLGLAGFESGHAYGKALRTVKSCVGTSWCRFGVGDSVGLAVELEERYKGIRAPHKFKGGVSGCVRECAEAQGKDFGVIATNKGWNVYVGGNGGAKPRHAELLATDVSREKAVKIIDRFLMLYIQSADRLQRTARWVESLGEGGRHGLDYLKSVIIDDVLGICKDLDDSMEALVGTYFDEWAEVVRNPEKRALFRQFVNTDETKEGIEIVEERGQRRPAEWSEEAPPLRFEVDEIVQHESQWKWRKVATAADLRVSSQGTTSIAVNYSDTQLAVFKLANGKIYATQQLCPHRRAFVLSDGLLGETIEGNPYISCPLHKRNFTLTEGKCLTDNNYKIITFEAKEENGGIFVKLPDPEAIDMVLGTRKWMVKQPMKENRGLLSHHVEIGAPLADAEKPALMMENIVQGCMVGNKNLDW